jgi:hypothetical protein
MSDGRKNNGNKGHSTKAKGVDKRKNKYLHLLDEASTEEEVVLVIKKLKEVATVKGDVQAIKLFLEYYLGKPKETIDLNHDMEHFDIREIFRVGSRDK